MNTTIKLQPMELLLGDQRGQYIPRDFADEIDWSSFDNIDEADMSELMKGPDDCENYWDIWQDVLGTASITVNGNTWRLMQDGDVWLYCYELMSNEDRINFGFDAICLNCQEASPAGWAEKHFEGDYCVDCVDQLEALT